VAQESGASAEAAWRTLGIANFRNYMAGNFVSQVGLWTQRVGVQWLTWELTESPTWLGIMAFADFFPIVLLAPVGGVLADRLNPLRALRLYIVLSGCLSAAIAALTLGGLITIEALLLLVLANGCVLAFNYPLRLSILHTLVGRESLTSAISINSVGFSISRIGGPALAGIIISQWGVGPAVSFTVFADIVFIAALLFVRLVNPRQARERQPLREIPREVMEGVRYVRRHAGLGPLVVVLVTTSLFARPFTDLFAGFADEVFGRGAGGLAWLTSMQGVGAAVGAILLARYHGVIGLTGRMTIAILVLAVAVLGFAATDIFWVALGCTLIAGYAMVALGVIEQSLMQAPVEDAVRGRVASLYILCARGCPAFGALLMGMLAEYAGLQLPIAGGAVVCVGLWLWARGRQARMAAALEKPPEDSTGT
jgi:MFS family permease